MGLYSAVALATVVVLLLAAAAALGGRREPFRWGPPDSPRHWARDPWPPAALLGVSRPGPGSPWWYGTAGGPYAGYAAPLELSLPLRNFAEYLYAYPPSARLPYNA